MPRFLSSYAANKRVEDGLRRKQEQIRQDYVRATHRYIDETEKLVDDLIQINVRTPSAFETSCPSSANINTGNRRAQANPQHPFAQLHLSNAHLQNVQQFGSTEQLALLRSRSRGNLTNDGTTDDGTSVSRKEIPLPIVQVRGKDVFYQYENQRSNWKKIEPTYRTRVLLHRNDTVANALKQYSIQKNPEQLKNTNETKAANRKNSIVAGRDSETRRGSIFSSVRRGSRRDSRLSTFEDDEYEDHHIPPIVELKPQLSPGHTPRMLDGWTIMNWCLWNKKQTKPVWASKRYIDKKNRELKKFQASRAAANRNTDLPAKPSSANPSAREARRKESMIEQPPQTIRAKSVPIRKISITIEEEDDEDIEKHFPDADRGQLRPTTSILRLRRDADDAITDENRPKTTQTHRRVALDTYTGNENDDNIIDLPLVKPIKEKRHTHFESQDKLQTPRSKSGSIDGKSVNICDPLDQKEEEGVGSFDNDDHCHSIVSDVDSRFGFKKSRMPGLAATQITITNDTNITTAQKNTPSLTPIVSLLKTPQKINYTSVHATPVFPRMQAVVPELGSDSPH